jgi:hypothetical protein
MTREHAAAIQTAIRYLRRVVARGQDEEAELLAALRVLDSLITPVKSR